jgi:Ca2+-binding RTX toxin-like protein
MKRKLISVIAIVAMAFAVSGIALAGGVYEGTSGDDTIHGNEIVPASSAIYGLEGNDRMWGGRGNDQLFGGPGWDRLHAFHAGAGFLKGGAGRDVCVVGEHPGGNVNVTVIGCEVIKYRATQGHG